MDMDINEMFTLIHMATARMAIIRTGSSTGITGITTDPSVGLEGSSTGSSKIREAERS
jgi:hypothetical protein